MTNILNNSPSTREKWLTGAALAAVVALCWGWIVPMALDMYGPMTGCSAWMMTHDWDFTHQVLLFAMWAVMMAGMMLPSAASAVFLYASTEPAAPRWRNIFPRAFAFAAGYVAVWTVFSLVATVLQWELTRASLLSPMMELRSRWIGGALVVVAGVFQLTPWKRKCLGCCRRPVGETGAFRSGLRNGLSCLGCCWALMLLLFVGGVMNLWWLAALTFFVALEKTATRWSRGSRLSGALLLAMGVWILR